MQIRVAPTYKQHLAYSKLRDYATKSVCFGGAAGGGKTWLGSEWLLTNCYLYPGSKWFIGRDELKQLTASTLVTFWKCCKYHRIPISDHKYNAQKSFIQFFNGSRIDLLELKYKPSDALYERYGSLEFTGGWIEEGGEVNFGAYDTLKSRVGRWDNDRFGVMGKLLITCNPKKNWLYNDFYKPWKSDELPDERAFIQAFVQENKYGESGYVDNLRGIKDKAKKERLLKGNWEYDDNPNALIDYDNILAVFDNDHVEQGKDKYITCDVARLGSDKAIVAAWLGWVVVELAVFDLSKLTKIQQAIFTFRKKYGIPKKNCIADQDGLGSGVVDNCGILGFKNGGRPIKEWTVNERGVKVLVQPNYANLKTQCYYHYADKVNEHGVYISCDLQAKHKEEIIEEHEQIQSFDTDSDRKVRLKPKEKVIDALGRSPDWTDTFAERAFFDLKKMLRKRKTGGMVNKV